MTIYAMGCPGPFLNCKAQQNVNDFSFLPVLKLKGKQSVKNLKRLLYGAFEGFFGHLRMLLYL